CGGRGHRASVQFFESQCCYFGALFLASTIDHEDIQGCYLALGCILPLSYISNCLNFCIRAPVLTSGSDLLLDRFHSHIDMAKSNHQGNCRRVVSSLCTCIARSTACLQS